MHNHVACDVIILARLITLHVLPLSANSSQLLACQCFSFSSAAAAEHTHTLHRLPSTNTVRFPSGMRKQQLRELQGSGFVACITLQIKALQVSASLLCFFLHATQVKSEAPVSGLKHLSEEARARATDKKASKFEKVCVCGAASASHVGRCMWPKVKHAAPDRCIVLTTCGLT